MKQNLFIMMVVLFACSFLLEVSGNFIFLDFFSYNNYFEELLFNLAFFLAISATVLHELLVYFYLIPDRKGAWAVSHLSRPQVLKETDWMTIITAIDEQSMLLMRLTLERFGIPCYVRHEGIQNLGFWAFTPNCEMDIQVPAQYAAEAQLALKGELPPDGVDIAWKMADSPEELDDFDAGLWHYNYGDYQRALELFQSAVEQDEDERDGAYYNIACCQIQLGRFHEARLALKEAIQLDANFYYDALLEENLAPLHEWLVEHESIFTDPSSLNEEDSFQAGLWHYSLGDYVRAMKLFQVALEQNDSEQEETYYNIACCYTKMGRFMDAREALKEAIKLDENNYYDALMEVDLIPHHAWLKESPEFTDNFPL